MEQMDQPQVMEEELREGEREGGREWKNLTINDKPVKNIRNFFLTASLSPSYYHYRGVWHIYCRRKDGRGRREGKREGQEEEEALE